jgi:3-hydroxyacyl-[acyl-carrier-protein] dehydratase
MGKIINFDEIKKNYLPHRYPFLLVDKVLNYEEGKWIDAIKNVTGNEEFFQGHFPNLAVMPGVLILEALAQASGILYFLTTQTRSSADNWFYFAGIDNAKFKRVIEPGDQLQLHAEIAAHKLNMWVFNVKATVAGELACSAEVKIAKKGGQ